MTMESSRPLARDYRDPHTHLGINLTPGSGETSSDFLVHECGFQHYENWNHRNILSPYWRLHYNFEAGNAIRSDGREFPLVPDSVVMVPGGVSLDTLGRETLPHLWIHFLPSQEFRLAIRQPVAVPIDAAIENVLGRLRSRIEASGSADSFPLPHLCKAILHLVFSRLEPGVFRAYPDRLLRLLEHIDDHLGSDLTMPSLCRISGLSRHRITELFRRHLDQTPSRYLSELRVRVAMQRLAGSSLSIEQIADELGFPNRYYFSRVFQKRLGCGPASFRRGQRNRG